MQGTGRFLKGLSAAVRDAIIALVTSGPLPAESTETPRLAGALRTRLKGDARFSPGERLLLDELLSRLVLDIPQSYVATTIEA